MRFVCVVDERLVAKELSRIDNIYIYADLTAESHHHHHEKDF